jgi:hypothetical protein
MTPFASADADLESAAYGELLEDIKARIRSSRIRAALAVNEALIVMYWDIGTEILRREREQGWARR